MQLLYQGRRGNVDIWTASAQLREDGGPGRRMRTLDIREKEERKGNFDLANHRAGLREEEEEEDEEEINVTTIQYGLDEYKFEK